MWFVLKLYTLFETFIFCWLASPSMLVYGSSQECTRSGHMIQIYIVLILLIASFLYLLMLGTISVTKKEVISHYFSLYYIEMSVIFVIIINNISHRELNFVLSTCIYHKYIHIRLSWNCGLFLSLHWNRILNSVVIKIC